MPDSTPLLGILERQIMTADLLAVQLAGLETPPHDELCRIYCPTLKPQDNIALRRVDLHQLAAQMTAFLAPAMRPQPTPKTRPISP